jgi:hypothetical protein
MSTHRAKEVRFSSSEQANQTMILDLESTVVNPRLPIAADEPTLVLDMTATQVGALLGEIEAKR